MDLNSYFKSITEQDECAVVICDTKHKIIYMNPAAQINYEKQGGKELVGKSILDCHNKASQEAIIRVTDWFGESERNNKVHTFYNKKQNKDVYMIALRDENKKLIGYYEKHEFRTIDSSPLYSI